MLRPTNAARPVLSDFLHISQFGQLPAVETVAMIAQHGDNNAHLKRDAIQNQFPMLRRMAVIITHNLFFDTLGWQLPPSVVELGICLSPTTGFDQNRVASFFLAKPSDRSLQKVYLDVRYVQVNVQVSDDVEALRTWFQNHNLSSLGYTWVIWCRSTTLGPQLLEVPFVELTYTPGGDPAGTTDNIDRIEEATDPYRMMSWMPV